MDYSRVCGPVPARFFGVGLVRRDIVQVRRVPVNEEDAVQVVNLVLQDARRQALAPDPHGLAERVHRLDHDLGGPLHVPLQAGDAQAALHPDLRPLALQNLGVDQGVKAVAGIEDDDALQNAELRRGQADPIGGAHDDLHLLGQFGHVVGDLQHRLGNLLEDRRALPLVLDNWIVPADQIGQFACGPGHFAHVSRCSPPRSLAMIIAL